MRKSERMASMIAVAFLRLYRYLLSPWIGWHCRFQPTCSCYSEDALQMHGFWRGGWLTFKRLVRCHPFARAGYDPVPPSTEPKGPS
jgi:putative membrane protein insertion efficiency factor